jgi:hypothetical protein
MGRIINTIVRVCRRVVKYDDLLSENDSLKKKVESFEKATGDQVACEKDFNPEEHNFFGWPNGHFYSPVHKLEDLDCYEEVVGRSQKSFSTFIPGFSEREMLKNFKRLKKYFKNFDYPKEDDGESRFYIKNCSYPITDSLVSFSMLLDIKPKRIIEIGSGFTSALMMDINERFFNNKIKITFVEPYPETLLSRMNDNDNKRYKIIPEKVQNVPLEVFDQLKDGDILFIDSTHVSKFNSDVNYELFEILPRLKSGVIIHFHDVFDGFEYPLQWLKNGWAWNEDYLLRAYLNGNTNYKVLMMNDYMVKRYSDLLLKSYTKVRNDCGGSLWIQKIK